MCIRDRFYTCPAGGCFFKADPSGTGAVLGYTSWCLENTEGPLCSVCSANFYKGADGKCVRCPTQPGLAHVHFYTAGAVVGLVMIMSLQFARCMVRVWSSSADRCPPNESGTR